MKIEAVERRYQGQIAYERTGSMLVSSGSFLKGKLLFLTDDFLTGANEEPPFDGDVFR